MKRALIYISIGLISFCLGWFFNETWRFAEAMKNDRVLDTLKFRLAIDEFKNNNQGKDKYATTMTVKFVDMDIETVMDVRCEDFEKSFDVIQNKVVKDSMKINQIFNTLKHLKTAGNEYYQHVDTRMKIEIKFNNDSIETICMDRFVVARNNQLFLNTDSLKYLLTGNE